MSATAKFLAMLAIIAVLAAAFWFGFFHQGKPLPDPNAPPAEPVQTARTSTSPFFSRPGGRDRATNAGVPVAEVPVARPPSITNWEDRVDEILVDDTEVEEKARKMLELLPNFPEAGQVETAHHISNLLPDEDYEKFGKYLSDPKTPVGLQDVVLMDVLNRPNEIKLPLLLETARAPGNAKAAEAKEMLELYLEEDFGDDWKKWEQEMEAWLKENPD